jgi:plasmid stability protein
MTTLTLKNIPEELHQRLRESAARHHRSLNREIIALLEERLALRRADVEKELEAVRRLRAKLPPADHALIDAFKREGRP